MAFDYYVHPHYICSGKTLITNELYPHFVSLTEKDEGFSDWPVFTRDFHRIRQETIKWCILNFGPASKDDGDGLRWYANNYGMHFLTARDAAFFKLSCGGYCSAV